MGSPIIRKNMNKEAPKVIEKKVSLPEVMEEYGAMFSINVPDGFAHLKFVDGKMVVTWLNEEGYVDEDGQEISIESIETVANFMREMKEMRLADYQKPTDRRSRIS